MDEIKEMAANILGVKQNSLPKNLIKIFDDINTNIKVANHFSIKELRSSQIVGLIVYLWELGIIK